MKKLLSITLSLIFVSALFAQSEFNYVNLWEYYHGSRLDVKPEAVANTTVTYITSNSKGEKKWEWKEKFNKNGKIVAAIKVNDGEDRVMYSNIYDANKKLENSKIFRKNGKLKKEIKIERTAEGKYKKVSQFKKEKLKKIRTYEYNISDCVESSKYLKGSGKLKNSWLYEYYSECDKKKTTLLKANGKVVKEWTYACKKEGEQLTKKDDVTQICQWEETDDKHLIMIHQSFDEKGKVVKVVNKYRAADTAIFSVKVYNGEDQLKTESTFNYDYSSPLTYKFFN